MTDTTAQRIECDRLLSECQSLHLATLSKDACPAISYAPFLWHEGAFFIYVSALARHTRNLIEQPQASLMLIEDEAQASNIFARKRLTVRCLAKAIARSDEAWSERLNALETKYGNTVSVLRALEDFQLFRLAPIDASLVVGFGQAHPLDAGLNPLDPLDREA